MIFRIAGRPWRHLQAVLAIIAWLACFCAPASGQRTQFRVYGPGDGLIDINPACLRQGETGYLLVCTEHGLFSYDGRRFRNLGPEQGLADGGWVHDLLLTDRAEVIVRYTSRIYVSRAENGPERSPEFLNFRPATSSVGPLVDEGPGRMAVWPGGAMLINDQRLAFLDTGHNAADTDQPPQIRGVGGLLDWPPNGAKLISLAAEGDSALWVGTAEGGLCRLRRTDHVCYGVGQGLPATPWLAILVTADGHVIARSQNTVADIAPDRRHIAISMLPDQGGIYSLRPRQLVLAQSPDGDLLTQAVNGLITEHGGVWSHLHRAGETQSVPITTVLFDRDGNLWLGATGHGIERALGYGIWASRGAGYGLVSDAVWQMSQQPGGPLWVATDGGVDSIEPDHLPLRSGKADEGATFSIYADPKGHVWRSDASHGLSRTTIATGETVSFHTPPVNQILAGQDGRLWLLTQGGVQVIEHADTVPSGPIVLPGLTRLVNNGFVASDGSLWVLSASCLVHVKPDGSVRTVVTSWPQPDFEPLVVAIADPTTFWVGGAAGGLFRLTIVDDHLTAIRQFGPPELASNSVVALLIDHRGWVWAGTDLGISVNDGSRWVSADHNDGLVSDDVNQGSLFEDHDGSIWIGTSGGLSHLLQPERLFDRMPLRPVIASMRIGSRLFRERAVPYTKNPLTVHVGTLDFKADAVMRFRYRLSGVDSGWADTDSGVIRYPSVPYGHHRFSLIAFNPLTHEASAPVSVIVRMRPPWWLWWPLQVAYAALAAGALYGAVRLRDLYIDSRREMLRRAVELRTRELREAQARDSLTGLLTRGEIQVRLMTRLADPERASQSVVGLLDVDHFKAINDRFGHLAGDEILKEIGRRLKAALAPDEYAGRYGGEEILIILEDGDRQGFARLPELCRAVCGRGFAADHELIRVTCSIGATRSRDVDDWKTLIGRADKALYRAKAEGRDRMVIADEDVLI